MSEHAKNQIDQIKWIKILAGFYSRPEIDLVIALLDQGEFDEAKRRFLAWRSKHPNRDGVHTVFLKLETLFDVGCGPAVGI